MTIVIYHAHHVCQSIIHDSQMLVNNNLTYDKTRLLAVHETKHKLALSYLSSRKLNY